MGLQRNKEPLAVISSNPGQALWTGIVHDQKAAAVVNRLLQPDMFNGWGIRTLSEKEKPYNPVAYHRGTVWPHDNAIIAVGFKKHGFDEEATEILNCMLDAGMRFKEFRLPEVFSGFSQSLYKSPVTYPVACHPQAWAAGSIPFLLITLLGIHPEPFDDRLTLIRPGLPKIVDCLEISNLRVGEKTIDLRFEKQSDGSVAAEATKNPGNIELAIQR
jgi:glycogen debranching enzyme